MRDPKMRPPTTPRTAPSPARVCSTPAANPPAMATGIVKTRYRAALTPSTSPQTAPKSAGVITATNARASGGLDERSCGGQRASMELPTSLNGPRRRFPSLGSVRRPGLECSSCPGNPPGQLVAGPVALRRVGVVGGAVSEDPAVHDEPGNHAELDSTRVVPLSTRAAEVLDQLVVVGVDPPGVVADRPEEVDHRMALAGAAPVEQDEAVAVEADLLVADVRVDQGGPAGVE